MNLKLYGFVIINFGVLIFIVNHHIVFDAVDSLIMPDSGQLCKIIPLTLVDKLKINTDGVSLSSIEQELSHLNLSLGGVPNKNKTNLYKTAIIVPYRDRLKNLQLFMRNIHPFLDKQNIYYGIYVIEPVDSLKFNRGSLINIGYREASKDEYWDCFIFHDVDLLPENQLNLYTCDEKVPKQLAVAMSSFRYAVDGYFSKFFGGVTAYTAKQFESINGFSNLYNGWGLEDDDARLRVLSKYSSIKRNTPEVGRYYANCHKQQMRNPDRFIIYINAKNRMEMDGLTTLNYRTVRYEKTNLFKRMLVEYD